MNLTLNLVAALDSVYQYPSSITNICDGRKKYTEVARDPASYHFLSCPSVRESWILIQNQNWLFCKIRAVTANMLKWIGATC